MKSVESALLYVGNPEPDFDAFAAELNRRVADLNIQFSETPINDVALKLNAPGLTVSIGKSATPIGADSFSGALDSPLSKPFLGVISDALARHSHSITITVSPYDCDIPARIARLRQLQLAHGVTTLLAQQTKPAAVHWCQSNQLLSGAQYLLLAGEATPWALFAKAQVIDMGQPDQMVRSYGLCLDELGEFTGRPVLFDATDIPVDEIHAAALAFVRHTVETGSAIPHGHSFGPKGGRVFSVSHVAPSPTMPQGMYEISAVASDTDTVPDDPARSSGAKLIRQEAASATADPAERTRSMAIGYMMLVIMPPIGVLLLISNAIFGSNAWRTSMAALSSVALALVIGAYTFLNVGTEEAAVLIEDETVSSVVLGQ